jgi:hypothetical protein
MRNHANLTEPHGRRRRLDRVWCEPNPARSEHTTPTVAGLASVGE